MTAVIGLAVLVVVFGACILLRAHRTPAELRGDWWSRFERDLRAYAERAPNGTKRPLQHRKRQP